MITTLEPTLAVRVALIEALKADGALTAIVGQRIYPSKTPTPIEWPFIRIDGLTSAPFRADGGSGGDVDGNINCFVKVTVGTPDPEAACSIINAHVVRIVDALEHVALEDNLDMAVATTSAQIIPDFAEADAFHGLVSFEALAL